MQVDLSTYNNGSYKPGNIVKRVLWYCINIAFFKTGAFPFSSIKVFLLKLFGASVGKGVIIKPFVNIKYPWFLTIGDFVWIGEEVWIDNLGKITIGSNVCISQGALLLSGSHDYSKTSFDLIVKQIIIEDGVWVCAKAIICGGVTCHSNSVITAGTVMSSNAIAGGIYRGNPGIHIKMR